MGWPDLLGSVGELLAPLLDFLTDGPYKRACQQAHLHIRSWLLQDFGLPFEEDAFGPRPPQAPGLGELKSHRLLRLQCNVSQLQAHPQYHQSLRLHTLWQRNAYFYGVSASAIVQDEQRRFWLVLFDGMLQPPPQRHAAMPITWQRPPARLRITELRARRALFNDAPAYRKAFGQDPTLAALTAFRKAHPEQEPQDD